MIGLDVSAPVELLEALAQSPRGEDVFGTLAPLERHALGAFVEGGFARVVRSRRAALVVMLLRGERYAARWR